MNRDMLSRRLIRQGYVVMTANDGEQGYATACAHDPDLILMDIGLPGMDGWQVTQLLEIECRHTRDSDHRSDGPRAADRSRKGA